MTINELHALISKVHPKSGAIIDRFKFDYGVWDGTGNEQQLNRKKTKGVLMYGNMIQKMSIVNRPDLILKAEDINWICKQFKNKIYDTDNFIQKW